MYALDNGIVNFSGFKTTFNHSVPINCDTGYEIHGDDQITCLPEGTWSSNSACHIKGNVPVICNHCSPPTWKGGG